MWGDSQPFMRSTLLTFVLLIPVALLPQDTIQVETTDVMSVCSAALPQSAPCATAPRAVSKENPTYSEKARRAHLEGVVTLGLEVDDKGNTRDIRVVKSVGGGLDEEAIKAVKRWKFESGTYEGKPVSVRLNVEVSFRLSAPSASAAGLPQTGNDQFRILFSDAQSALGRRDYQTAANLGRRLTTMAPSNSYAWNLLGVSLLELHELTQAASALETSVKLDPASAYSYNSLGRVYWQQRRYSEAQAQFQKQIAINPDDHYAHGNLGVMLRDQKKCNDALPELEKALALTPNNTTVMLALGECNLDLGNTAKGISFLEQATSEGSSPGTWNSAAYQLARRNLELDRAQKWAEAAISGESAQLHNFSLDHLSTAQLGRVSSIASFWDTMGWVLFQRGDYAPALKYLQAAFSLRALPVFADHLGRVYEALAKPDDASHAFALAVAAADSPLIQPLNPDEADSVADARQRLSKALPSDKATQKAVDSARSDLTTMRTVFLDNSVKASGSADFTVNISSSAKDIGVHQLSGDASFAVFSTQLQSATLPSQFAPSADVDIPRRGTLTCEAAKSQCSFVLMTADDALDLSRREGAAETAVLTPGPLADPHAYNNPALGMSVTLPDEWQLIHEEPGTFSRPHNAILGKPGALAFLLLTRERMEGSDDLYSKMLESSFAQREEYRRTGEMEVKRDGIPGTRWNIGWKDKGVTYVGIMEFFSVGDDHYRLTAMAPSEVYSRYSESFEDMLRSVRFPMLHNDPKLFEKP
jgi:TonB family protein